jgi:ABC-type proline/glycine betaine transport system permease subunit
MTAKSVYWFVMRTIAAFIGVGGLVAGVFQLMKSSAWSPMLLVKWWGVVFIGVMFIIFAIRGMPEPLRTNANPPSKEEQ